MSSKFLTNKLITELLGDCVSNINYEFSLFYPELVQPTYEHFDSLKAFGILRLRKIIGDSVDDELNVAKINLVRTMIVRSYGSKRNAEISFDLEFDELCNRMNQETNVDVRTLSVREFYSLFKYIKKQQKPSKGKMDKFL